MGLRSNSRPRRRHKMATDLSPGRKSRVKGQGPEWLDTRSQSSRNAPPVAAAASLTLVQGTSKAIDGEKNALWRPPEGALTARAHTPAQCVSPEPFPQLPQNLSGALRRAS